MTQRARKLTGRQLQILALAADGHTDREIGRVLYVTVDTVKAHLRRVYRRLGARNRAHAAVIALRKGLIS